MTNTNHNSTICYTSNGSNSMISHSQCDIIRGRIKALSFAGLLPPCFPRRNDLEPREKTCSSPISPSRFVTATLILIVSCLITAFGNSSPSSNIHKGLFVAVGEGVAAAYSYDGITWQKSRNLPFDLPWNHYGWNSVTYGNRLFVAVTFGGAAYSSDGVVWHQAYGLSADMACNRVAFGNGVFVAISDNGEIASSRNGKDWYRCKLPARASWGSVAFGNGRFVTLSSTFTAAMYSTDGVVWYNAESDFFKRHYGAGTDLIFADGNFFFFSDENVYTSADGETWNFSQSQSCPGWTGVVHGNGLFVGFARYPQYMTGSSADGTNWTLAKALPAGFSLWHLSYGNERFVAVGTSFNLHGQIDTAVPQSIYSTDGLTWRASNGMPLSSRWNAVAYGYGPETFVDVAGTNTR